MTKNPRPAVERSTLSLWDDMVANEELVEHLQDSLHGSRFSGHLTGHNTLVYGPSRTGKTAACKLFIRSLLCRQLDPVSLNPCARNCLPCREKSERFGRRGLEQQVDGIFIHCETIDCTAVTETDLREKLMDMRDYSGIRVVYLDEVHRLARRNMDEQLLKQMEEKDFIWIASAISVKGLEEAFLNRFSTKIRTELPGVDELATWLERRCEAIDLQWDDRQTLIRLAERANTIPGLALHVVARADRKRQRRLTRELVEQHRFTCDD